jgi:hypothetical protein
MAGHRHDMIASGNDLVHYFCTFTALLIAKAFAWMTKLAFSRTTLSAVVLFVIGISWMAQLLASMTTVQSCSTVDVASTIRNFVEIRVFADWCDCGWVILAGQR